MRTAFELYATGEPSPDTLWATVGDPWRLASWTDADRVVDVDPSPVTVGSVVTVVAGGVEQHWRVHTVEPRLIEATTGSDGRQVSLGVRVAGDRRGSRLVLAGAIEHPGGWQAWRARLVKAPRWRRRFDRWSRAALRASGSEAGHA